MNTLTFELIQQRYDDELETEQRLRLANSRKRTRKMLRNNKEGK